MGPRHHIMSEIKKIQKKSKVTIIREIFFYQIARLEGGFKILMLSSSDL
jgi:hypothetical protein